jgi:tetratricopeptide (TPR) repeat protein
MARLVAGNPHSFEAYLARGHYRQSFHALDEAAKDLATALSLAPQNVEVLLTAADVAQSRNRLDEARDLLRRGMEIAPREARWYTTLALLEQRAGRDEEAIHCLRRGLKAVPESDQTGILLALVDLLIPRNELTEAAACLARLRLRQIDPVLLDYQGARILLQQSEWGGALRIFERITPALTKTPELALQAHLCRGLCYEKLGALDLQVEALRRALTLDPSSMQAHLQLGSALLALDRVDEAVPEFEQITDAPTSARILLAQALLLQTARLPAAERRWQRLEQVLEQTAKRAPSALPVLLLQAEVLALQGQPDRGRQLLAKGRDQHPDQADFWVALARWDEQVDNGNAVTGVLDEADKRLGRRAELQLARLDHLLLRQSGQAGPFVRQLEQQLGQYPAAAQLNLLSALAQAHARLGERKEAERLWNQLAEQQPTHLDIQLRLFDLALQTGDAAALDRHLEAIKTIEGEQGTLWRYGTAARLVRLAAAGSSEDLDQARALLTEVHAKRPDWPLAAGLEAEICERQNNPEAGLANYQRALDLGDRRPTTLQRMLKLLYERGRFAEAARLMARPETRAPLPRGLQQLAVEISLQTQDSAAALALAQQAVDKEPNEYQNQFLLGLSLWAAGREREAEAALQQAVRLDQGRTQAWVALVDLLVDSHQQPRAAAVVGEAENKMQGRLAALALAHCHEKLGQNQRAEQDYQAALAKNPDNPALLRQLASFYLQSGAAEKSQPLLRTLLRPGGGVPASDVAWARRNLALAIAAGGSYQQFKEGLSCLDASPTTEADLDDLRVKARLLATRPAYYGDAIRLYEQIALRGSLTAEEQFLVVQLCGARRDWSGSRRWRRELLAADPQRLDYLFQAARASLFEGNIEEAKHWSAQLDQFHPGAYQTAEIKARLLHQEGRGTEAADLLEKFAQSQPTEQLPLSAALLDEWGHVAAAEKLWRNYVARAKRPESVLSLAGFLARQQRPAEALDLFERAWPTLPPVVVGGACVAALGYASPCDPAQCRKVHGWLRNSIERDPKPSMLLALLADLETLQGHRAEAAALYRESLTRDNRNAWALGNLAWLLAHEDDQAQEALELVQRAEEVIGPVAVLRDVRALAYLKMNRPNLAIEELRLAVQENPLPSTYFHLAQAFTQASDRLAARNALRQVSTAVPARGVIHPLETAAYHSLLEKLNVK